ncbi:MAG: hypothetical protein O3C57_02945 [Verrucomicrobia bacterium]|nr:hypothetical protein [Verrucomicrobiota bacterium]
MCINNRRSISAITVLVALAFLPALMAQTARPGSAAAKPTTPAKVLKVKQARVIGRQTLVATPEFRTSIPQSGGRPMEWSKLEIEYDTAPEWIDVVTVKFFVMTQAQIDGKAAFSIFRETVDYVDVEQGRGHLADVFLRPQTVKRYGEPAVVHIEFLVGGEIVDEVDELDPSMRNQLPPDWYKNNAVLQKESVTVRDGYLLNRAKTPFGLVNIDSYEVIR